MILLKKAYKVLEYINNTKLKEEINMGNRAVITTRENFNNDGVGVYLHWNGGKDSVEAFLTYCKMKGYRTPTEDNYGWARLCQVIGNFFGGELSIGIDKCSHLDCNNYDNGTYIIDGWEIVDRKYFEYEEQDNYDLYAILCDIDECQPQREQLGAYKIKKTLNDMNKEREVI